MAAADPLSLAVRENAAWCDLVCRLHRFAPEGDTRLWWSTRRTPDLFPDAVTLVPDLAVLDVLGRIADSPGASVKDSFATLDLSDQGWTVRFDAMWIARSPGAGADAEAAAGFAVVREKFAFHAWCRAWGGPEGVLPVGLRRAGGVTVLGRPRDPEFADGGILHRTEIGGVPVVGLWNAFGDWAAVAAAASTRHPDAWIVGYEQGTDLDAALAAGFEALGPLRVWSREAAPS